MLKVERTHRLPDLYVWEHTFMDMMHRTVELAGALEFSRLAAAADVYSRELSSHLTYLDSQKPNKNFRGTDCFTIYGVEVSIQRDLMSNRYMDVKFITDWKFFSNHARKPYYGYVIKIIPVQPQQQMRI